MHEFCLYTLQNKYKQTCEQSFFALNHSPISFGIESKLFSEFVTHEIKLEHIFLKTQKQNQKNFKNKKSDWKAIFHKGN